MPGPFVRSMGLTLLIALPGIPAGPSASDHPTRVATFAGGCFWGVEAVFEHLRGVTEAVSGYGDGGVRVEAVRVTYDPDSISYRQLLDVFFTVAHDPTQRDHQGPDIGPEYRAIVFYGDSLERRTIEYYVAELTAAHAFPHPIVTEIRPGRSFRVAEAFHQDYAARHPDDPYIVINDRPKLDRLRRAFPALYRATEPIQASGH